MTVWTSGNICSTYGISRSNFAYWRRQPDFPAPLTYAKNQGGTWDAALVRSWVTAFRAKDPRRHTAVVQLRRGATVSAVARNLGVDRKTVRRWRDAAQA